MKASAQGMNTELRDHLRLHLKWGNLQGDELIRFLVLALCGECGELANEAKKEWRDGSDRRALAVGRLNKPGLMASPRAPRGLLFPIAIRPAGPRHQRPAAAAFATRPLRLRCATRSVSAAGVIPSMRAAWALRKVNIGRGGRHLEPLEFPSPLPGSIGILTKTQAANHLTIHGKRTGSPASSRHAMPTSCSHFAALRRARTVHCSRSARR